MTNGKFMIKVMIYSFNSTINKKDIVIWKWFIFHLMVIVKIKINRIQIRFA